MHLKNITFDADDPQRLASFWSEATGRRLERSEQHFAMLTSDQDDIRMLFLKVPERKVAKNRMHLDFHAANRERKWLPSLALAPPSTALATSTA